MSVAREQYREALHARRRGEVSTATGSTPFQDVKSEFYADSRILSEDVLRELRQYRTLYPPHGLVIRGGGSFADAAATRGGWLVLESGLTGAVHHAYNTAVPSIESCPYHEVISRKLRPSPLAPLDHNERGLDTLRQVSAPGGLAAPALVVNLLRRIPAMARFHGAETSFEDLARNSKGLLRDPLAHPQQHARAFMYCLTGEEQGDGFSFDREQFLPDFLIEAYTRLETDETGREQFAWSRPTSEFVVRAALDVQSRVLGSELDARGDHVTAYPSGIRLADIEIDEETIGCPGSPVAYELWDQAIDVIAAEGLWHQT